VSAYEPGGVAVLSAKTRLLGGWELAGIAGKDSKDQFWREAKNRCATRRNQRKIGNVSERTSSESGKDSRGTAAL
jgi:hypothetical protein